MEAERRSGRREVGTGATGADGVDGPEAKTRVGRQRRKWKPNIQEPQEGDGVGVVQGGAVSS